MSLSDEWATGLGNVELSYLYRICNRAIEEDERAGANDRLRSKGEQDVAWAVKQEFERRLAGHMDRVWLTREEWGTQPPPADRQDPIVFGWP